MMVTCIESLKGNYEILIRIHPSKIGRQK
jgi:hypothetical protein